MPTTEQFRTVIREKLAAAEFRGETSLTINAGDIGREIGGYGDGNGHQMMLCSRAMHSVRTDGDTVLPGGPPKGHGPSLTIEFRLPRPGSDSERAADQHAIARDALPIIGKAARAGELLRYGDLAEKLGRPRDNARTVAQACNLLDSAANHAKRPLMALWTVRDTDWGINSEAWQTEGIPGLKDALIDQARDHRFTQEDEDAIGASLVWLKGLGAQKAWERMNALVPYEQLLARLMEREPPPGQDSLNDLDPGSDLPISEPVTGRRFIRNPKVRAAVLERAEGKCEFCGEPGFMTAAGTVYLEAHHILALSQDGKDRRSNVIALCPLDHRRAHLARERKALNRRMARIVGEKEGKAVPSSGDDPLG